MQTHYWMGASEFPEEFEACSSSPDEEEGKRKPVVAKTFDRLHKMGLTDEMLREAGEKGAKNQVIGTYRIALFQVQRLEEDEQKRQAATDDAAKLAANGAADRASLFRKTSSKVCTIL